MNRLSWPLSSAYLSVFFLLIHTVGINADEPLRNSGGYQAEPSATAAVPNHTQIINQPPVISVSQFLIAAGITSLVIAALLVWIYILRRQVARQALQLNVMRSLKTNAVRRLAGEIAHDFNNFLTVISCNLPAISNHTSADYRESIDAIASATTRATKRTKKLLQFANGPCLDQKLVSVHQLLRNTKAKISSSIDSPVTFHFGDCEPNDFFVNVDEGQMQQALINLCQNAYVQANEKIAEVSLSVTHCHRELGDCICISIKGNGSGLSEQERLQIFDPFFTSKQSGESTGLGLAIAQGVVEQHGGVVNVESDDENFIDFQVILPKCDEPSTKLGDKRKGSDVDPRSQRILVVDDEAQIRETHALLLESLDHTVLLAENGMQAISMLATEPPFDLVLLDLTMPEMSGLETYQEIRSVWPEQQVVFCSEHSKDCSSLEVNGEKMPKVLSKPVDIDAIQVLFCELFSTA